MTKSVNLQGQALPSGADVEVNIEIHTRIQISASAAKQKANVCLAMHCGQNFCVDDPVLQVGDATTWIVPVWVTTLQEERLAKIGELVVDAQTGEIVESEDHCRTLRRLANALLSVSALAPAPTFSEE